MINISTYSDKWRLKLSIAITTTTAFHLNNREANRQLKIFVRGSLQPYQRHRTYLGVKLDRQFTYRQHLEGLRSNVSARNSLIRCLAETSWGAKTLTLRISALAVAFSAAEYAAPAWSRSKHTRKLNVALNDTRRIVAGCLQPTPTECLPVLAGIPPPCCVEWSLPPSIFTKLLLLNTILCNPHSFYPRKLFTPTTAPLSTAFHPSCSAITWYTNWSSARSRLIEFGWLPASKLPRKGWSILNRLRTRVGCFNYCSSKWGLRSSSSCSCGIIDQFADHVIVCPLNRASSGKRGIMQLDEPT